MEKIKANLTYIVTGIAMCTLLYTCSVNNNVKKLKKNNVVLVDKINAIDSVLVLINNKIVDRYLLEDLLIIQGLEISKNVVYDNNTIVRSKSRPDDVMSIYQKEIDKLRKQIK